jgi:gliding motility-associated protein GldE
LDPEPYSFLSLILLSAPFDWTSIPYALGLVVLLASSAMISGSEVAFFGLSNRQLQDYAVSNDKKEKLIYDLLGQPKRLLATILISNNFVNIGIVLLSNYLTDLWFSFGSIQLGGLSINLGFIFKVVFITFILLLFGEVLPKIYANRNITQFARIMAEPTGFLTKVLRPLSQLLTSSAGVIENRLEKKTDGISVEDLSHALELSAENEEGHEDQKILEGIINFGSTDVKQIMKPRTDVVAIPTTASYKEVLEIILENGFSRLPVFKDSFDQIEGILYIKDVLPNIDAGPDFSWLPLIREPFFVPETKKINDLLNDFKSRKVHMSIVVDEYGGTSGIVTLEDVLEEIVGEISDEFDTEDLIYSKLDENTYVFEGKISLKDFYRIIDIEGESFEAKKGESDTLAGFILEISGKFPEKNEEIGFDRFLLKVESIDKRRIKRVKVTIVNVDIEEKS